MTDPIVLMNLLKLNLENDPRVLAFVLVGSQAREDIYKATKHSDMEAYIITKDENAENFEKDLHELVKKFGKVLFSFRHAIGFIAVYEDLFRLELPVIKESGLEGLFNRPKSQTVKVLIDRTGGKLQKILDSRPETLEFAVEFEDKVTNFWHWLIIAAQYLKKGEVYNARAVVGMQSHFLIWLYELLNNPDILLLETNKRIEKFLTKTQLDVLNKVIPPYNSVKIKDSLIKEMEIFPELFAKVKQKYQYKFDKSLEEKVKPRVLKLLNTD